MTRTSFLDPLARTTTRIVAGIGALLLAVTGLTVLTASAAHADTASNEFVTLTVDVSPDLSRYTTETDLTFTVTVVASDGNAMDCDVDVPILSWGDGVTPDASGSETASTLTRHVGTKPAGDYQFSGSVFPEGGCNQGGQVSVPVHLYIYPATESVDGHAYRGNVPPSDADDYEPADGVTVELLAVDDGPDAAPVDSATTGPDGSYTLTAPTITEDEFERDYKIRFTYPDSTVVYYEGSLDAWSSSTSDWDEAWTTSPDSWSPSTSLDAIATTATPPSETNENRYCGYSESESTYFETNTVSWYGICETDPSIEDAETYGGLEYHDDALDNFGYVWFDQGSDYYDVTADDFETSRTGNELTTVLHDDDIFLAELNRFVDVTVTRTFQGSFARWVVDVRDSETGEIATDVPFHFSGGLGSDSDTVWNGSGNWRVSDDNLSYPHENGDPILAHHVTAADFTWDMEDIEYPDVVVRGGQLTYLLAVIDYQDCVGSTARAAASTLAQAMPGNFGTEFSPLAGDACATQWSPAPVFDEMTAGVPFDQTFTVNSPLDWSEGGSAFVSGLPSGLNYQTLHQDEDGVAPQLRVYGTPQAEGTYRTYFDAWGFHNPSSNSDTVTVELTILPGDGPSLSHEARICDPGYSTAPYLAFNTASVYWTGVCLSDPTIEEAETVVHENDDAFDRVGDITFDQGATTYTVTADSYTSDVVDGALVTILQDDDIVLPDDSSVDVTVTRTIEGSFARWVVEVRDSVTGDIVDAPFTFTGELGSDNSTVWGGSGDWRTSDDGSAEPSGGSDPGLAHYAVGAAADSVGWDTENVDGYGKYALDVDGGELTYIVGVIDYANCDVDGLRAALAEIAQAMPGNFGQDLSVSEGCNSGWPLPTLNEMRVATAFDQTLTVASTALDWEFGGEAQLSGLPDGLDWEALHTNENGTAPQVRIFGTPTEAGPYQIDFSAVDDSGDEDRIVLIGTVLGPVQSSDIHLNFGTGDPVGGSTADVTGTGLKAGSPYTVIVESTPQTVADGVIGGDLLLNTTVTMPTGLEAGWHSITLNGTFYDGTALTNRLWIQIAENGTLLAVSSTAPPTDAGGDPDTDPAGGTTGSGLASSGADAAGILFLAFALLLLGGLVTLLWRRRTSAG